MSPDSWTKQRRTRSTHDRVASHHESHIASWQGCIAPCSTFAKTIPGHMLHSVAHTVIILSTFVPSPPLMTVMGMAPPRSIYIWHSISITHSTWRQTWVVCRRHSTARPLGCFLPQVKSGTPPLHSIVQHSIGQWTPSAKTWSPGTRCPAYDTLVICLSDALLPFPLLMKLNDPLGVIVMRYLQVFLCL